MVTSPAVVAVVAVVVHVVVVVARGRPRQLEPMHAAMAMAHRAPIRVRCPSCRYGHFDRMFHGQNTVIRFIKGAHDVLYVLSAKHWIENTRTV